MLHVVDVLAINGWRGTSRRNCGIVIAMARTVAYTSTALVVVRRLQPVSIAHAIEGSPLASAPASSHLAKRGRRPGRISSVDAERARFAIVQRDLFDNRDKVRKRRVNFGKLVILGRRPCRGRVLEEYDRIVVAARCVHVVCSIIFGAFGCDRGTPMKSAMYRARHILQAARHIARGGDLLGDR